MKKSALTIKYGEPGKLIYPAHYTFAKAEKAALDLQLIKRYDAVVIHDFSAKGWYTPSVHGLASIFTAIKTDRELDAFARRYGLLGVDMLDPKKFEELGFVTSWGHVLAEPVAVWRYHIENVRRLLKLYRALRDYNLKKIVFERQFLRIRQLGGLPKGWEPEWQIFWAQDNSQMGFSQGAEPDEHQAAVIVLMQQLQKNLHGGIQIEIERAVPSKDAVIGFRFVETRSTTYLLAAIYHDLLELISENRPVAVCANCGLPFAKQGRGKYCCNACKQAAYRLRLKIMGGEFHGRLD
ncbi:MAG: hypothetical protein QME76_02100 [Bacillota bacterium]|nr:hypothetical protein [Bacillota bacterium]